MNIKNHQNDDLDDLVKIMFAQCCMQFSRAFVQAMAAPNITANNAANAIYGTIGSIVHQIPDDKWKAMLDVKPCGGPECDCHVHMKEFMMAMDKLRIRALEVVGERKAQERGEQSHEM